MQIDVTIEESNLAAANTFKDKYMQRPKILLWEIYPQVMLLHDANAALKVKLLKITSKWQSTPLSKQR